jgi:hypothetical protein
MANSVHSALRCICAQIRASDLPLTDFVALRRVKLAIPAVGYKQEGGKQNGAEAKFCFCQKLSLVIWKRKMR